MFIQKINYHFQILQLGLAPALLVTLVCLTSSRASAEELHPKRSKERDSYHLEQAVTARDWSKVNCPKPRLLAQELLEILISGGGPQGFNPSCVVPTKFEHVRVMHFEDLDRSKALPLDDGTPYRIESVSTVEDGDSQKFGAQVVFFVRESNKVKRIKDTFVFRSYQGKAKTYFGCAAVLFPPQNLFTKKSCLFQAGTAQAKERVPASKSDASGAAGEKSPSLEGNGSVLPTLQNDLPSEPGPSAAQDPNEGSVKNLGQDTH